MYVDEVGNSDLGASEDPNHRYLSLTGVILDLIHVASDVHPQLEELKNRYFDSHPDEPVVLHRKDIMKGTFPFQSLRDAHRRAEFDLDLLAFIERTPFHAITVVIDKLEHKRLYKKWRYDPYHYCLVVLVERYCWWLRERDGQGDVLAESRGGKEDRRLKDSFSRLYTEGTEHVAPDVFKQYLTSKQLKVKPKSNNVAGLQLADLIAHPSYRDMKVRREGVQISDDFGTKVVALLNREKYSRSSEGKVDGWGRKWLP